VSPSSNLIQVPKPSPKGYNSNRLLAGNTLLQHQLVHFHAAEHHLPVDQQTGIDIQLLKTEGEASAYIRKVTAILHPQGKPKQKVRKAT
jgi:hypothetical protein